MSFAVPARASGIFTPGKRAKGVERMKSDSSQLLVKEKQLLSSSASSEELPNKAETRTSNSGLGGAGPRARQELLGW